MNNKSFPCIFSPNKNVHSSRDSIIHAYFCHSYVTLIKNYYLIMVQRKTRKTISTSNNKSANSGNTSESNSSLNNMEEKKTILYYPNGTKMGGVSTLEIGTPYFFDFFVVLHSSIHYIYYSIIKSCRSLLHPP